jgi:hypothetical protein
MAKTVKKIAQKPKSKQRKIASVEMYPLIHSYEKVSEKTVYSKIYFDKNRNTWRYIGKAHDYSW